MLFIASIVALIGIILWGVIALRHQTQYFNKLTTTLQDTLYSVLDDRQCYKNRKISFQKVFCPTHPQGAMYTYRTALTFNEPIKLNTLSRIVLGIYFPLRKHINITVTNERLGFNFPDWQEKHSDPHYVRNVLDEISHLADQLEKNKI